MPPYPWRKTQASVPFTPVLSKALTRLKEKIMLTTEVINMRGKKAALLLLALLTLLTAHVRPVYRLTLDGAALDGLYSAEDIRQAWQTAEATAAELLDDSADPPLLERRLRLSLRQADGDRTALTHALILAWPGVILADGVFVNGVRLGTVTDGALLAARLRQSILDQMPNAAVFGNISGQLEIRPVYSRLGRETDDRDMILLISGMAPVVYVDKDGKIA